MGCNFSRDSLKKIDERHFDPKDYHTGDLIVLDGQTWASWFTKLFIFSSFGNHMGMIIRIDNKPYLWHSSSNEVPLVPCLIANKSKSGPQLTEMSSLMKVLTSPAYRISLQGSTQLDEQWKTNDALRKFVTRQCRTGIYTENILQIRFPFFQAKYDIESGYEKNEWFCSELVVHTYKMLCLVPSTVEAGHFFPQHFQPGTELSKMIKFHTNKQHQFSKTVVRILKAKPKKLAATTTTTTTATPPKKKKPTK